MKLEMEVVKRIIRKLMNGEDYRIEVVLLLDATFLEFALDFFEKVVHAKLKHENISTDWYKKEFLNPGLPKEDIAINSGLNMKTIANMRNTATREIVLSESNLHYDQLFEILNELAKTDRELELTITIRLNGVGVDLSLSESLVVINTIAVKRAALRGGLWSTAGKRVEKPLMETLCELYKVSSANYSIRIASGAIAVEGEFDREIDFYLCTVGINHKCEVKLMGKGNPESADAVIARHSKVFVADKLSDSNKRQLDSLDVLWVELRSDVGYRKFGEVLDRLGIPHTKPSENIDASLTEILNRFI
jgi:hypothetical protein